MSSSVATKRTMLVLLSAIVLFTVTPFLLWFAVIEIRESLGCGPLNDIDIYPCLVGGVDVNPLLAGLLAVGIFGFASLPIGTVAFLLWLVAAVILYFRRESAAIQD